jgi:SAM-dependent methyltransferase
MKDALNNVDETVAAGFGHEWSTFQQDEGNFSVSDREALFRSYFQIFPREALPPDPVGLDVGCGSGRWSVLVAPRVGHLHLLDASPEALAVARKNLSRISNTTFHLASVGDIPLPDGSLDFAFSAWRSSPCPGHAVGHQGGRSRKPSIAQPRRTLTCAHRSSSIVATS